MLECYVQTMPGIEKIAWLEIKKRLHPVKFGEYLFAKDRNGIVRFQVGGAVEALLELRTTEDAFVLALSVDNLSRDWGDLRQVTALIQESGEFNHALGVFRGLQPSSAPLTYRVISRKEGEHQYRRKDLEEAVYKGTAQRLGRKWRTVEDDATLEIWVNLLGSRLLCGLRLSDRTMRHRAYKSAHMGASLRPSVAAAMVLLTEPAADDIFVDPMCGAGTLLAERVQAGPYGEILGGDIVLEHTLLAQQNLEPLGESEALSRWDARRLPLASASIDKIATNLPFGKQISSAREIKQLYPAVFSEIERVLKPGGRAVVLSSEYDLVKEVVRQRGSLHITTGYSIAVLGQWSRIYLIDKKT